ncbi:SusC/RagA family TonB-linked outer membrane protein [Dysgonomonas reticulitermitis]
MEKQNLAWFIKRCVFLLACLLGPVYLMAQSVKVSGTIVDEKSEPIIGVSVVVKGTINGTVSDENGNFTLNVPDENTLLSVTYVGYISQEIKVGAKRRFDIVLKENQQLLDEVVIVGYGTQKKVNLTGAVGTISSEELITRAAPNTASLLQGRVPGLQVVQNSGQPGSEGNNLQIRGMGTFSSAGNNPLILIDGVAGDMTKVNPNTIESVSVLKDAASAAIYGSRAANGVILITTKNGSEGRLNIDFGYTFALQTPTEKQKRITNSVEYMELMNKAVNHTGLQPTWKYTDEEIESYRQGYLTNPAQYPNTDWVDDVTRNAPMNQYYLSVNGGKGGTTYNFGAGILDQKGVMIETGYKKYDVQFNFKTNLGGRVTFGTNMNFSTGDRYEPAVTSGSTPEAILDFNATEDQMLCAYAMSPLIAPYLPDGSGRFSTSLQGKGGNKNPVAIAKGGNKKKYKDYYALLSAYVNVKIIEGLNAEVKGSIRHLNRTDKALTEPTYGYYFFPDNKGEYLLQSTWNSTERQLTVRDIKETQYTLFGTLTYAKSFNQEHNLTALLGYSQENLRNEKLAGYRIGTLVGDMWELDTAPTAGMKNIGNAYEWGLQSIFGRINYDFRGKYLLEANFRNDGSSRFREGNRWGFFPSVSAGWRASEEEFLKNVSWLSNLKVRGSWGQLGNQNIGNYPYQDLLSSTYSGGSNPIIYNFGGTPMQGIYKQGLNVPDIKWETTTIADVGLDFGFFNSKLYGSIDWYNKTTTDILRSLQVPNFIGLSAPTVNDGKMQNKGWEFVLGHQNSINGFKYSINANLETYRNKLLKYGAREINSGNGQIKEEGLPWNSYYMYIFDGIYQTQAEIDEANAGTNTNNPKPLSGTNPKPGDMKYKDTTGDGKVTTDDRIVVKGAFPDFNYGFNINMEYKGFDLSMFFQGVQGGKVYLKEWGIAPFRQAAAPAVFWRGAWDGEGTSNSIPHIFNESYAANTQVSTWWLQDASYLRLKNLQIGYTLSKSLVSKFNIQNLRVYFSGDNLWTHSNMFQGIDPERTAANARAVIYPQTKIYSFGVKITL